MKTGKPLATGHQADLSPLVGGSPCGLNLLVTTGHDRDGLVSDPSDGSRRITGRLGPMRIGMLTGGGDCPGLNAVIRAAVTKGILAYGHEFVGFCDGWKGPLEGLTRPLGLTDA